MDRGPDRVPQRGCTVYAVLNCDNTLQASVGPMYHAFGLSVALSPVTMVSEFAPLPLTLKYAGHSPLQIKRSQQIYPAKASFPDIFGSHEAP